MINHLYSFYFSYLLLPIFLPNLHLLHFNVSLLSSPLLPSFICSHISSPFTLTSYISHFFLPFLSIFLHFIFPFLLLIIFIPPSFSVLRFLLSSRPFILISYTLYSFPFSYTLLAPFFHYLYLPSSFYFTLFSSQSFQIFLGLPFIPLPLIFLLLLFFHFILVLPSPFIILIPLPPFLRSRIVFLISHNSFSPSPIP